MWLPSRISVCCVLLAGPLGLPGAFACGPFFPNQLLVEGDNAVLDAPVANFASEVARIEWAGATEWARQADTNFDARTTAEVDVSELSAALVGSEQSGEALESLIAAYAETREALAAYVQAKEEWHPTRLEFVREGEEMRAVEIPVPPLPSPRLRVPKGVPAEFAHYLCGAIAFHEGNLPRARVAWEMVLTLPPEQRRHRSTWAAFMLGKTCLETDPPRAIEYFQRVRQLAREGFADSLRLAVDSLGWEAKVELGRKNYERAMELYVCQNAAGDWTAVNSVRFVAAALARETPEVVRRTARHPLCRQVMLAWVISREDHDEEWIEAWLDVVERSGARDVRGAERLAWAAYQRGDMDAARRWIARAPGQSPATQWVRAKLLLRDGRVDEATALLAKLIRAFPNADDWNGAYKPHEWPGYNFRPTQDEVAGELGVLKLSRGQYTEALDLLLRAGYPIDAAYVAERVLTPGELMVYVNRRWSEAGGEASEGWSTSLFTEQTRAAGIRYLLGRRLTRLGRWDEARPYVPAELQPVFERYVQAMRLSKDCALADEECAEWLWEAAKITRWWGMALIGTAVDPDWHMLGNGSYEMPPIHASRGIGRTNDLPEWVTARGFDVTAPHNGERARVSQSSPAPETRFHYRYLAAELAWQAAQLLPDDSDATANVLCEAGSWLKLRDPKAADRFYKALVRRCRHTELGDEADRRRWFPPVAEAEMPSTIP